jgi:hypothetical protein
MPQETRIDVPSDDVEWLSDRLAEAGLAVMDTGERVVTDHGEQAVLCAAEVDTDGQASMPRARVRR